VQPAPGERSAGTDDLRAKAPSGQQEVRPQGALKQEVAKNEREIDAQQKVSTEWYIEAKRAAASEEEVLVLPLQPDEVRERMAPIDPAGPEMRCGQAIPPESSVTTRDIELRARSSFQGKHGDAYAWKYVVTFKNRGRETVQMLTRHWVFVDAQGRLDSEVKGPGARGVTPVLPPGGEWSYESGTSLATPYGSMHGSFQFEVLQGSSRPADRSFSGRVGRLLLASGPGDRREVPCISSASASLLPLTSVLSTERVILGGRAEFVGRRKVKEEGGKGESWEYAFSYDVQLNNARADLVQVVAHSWTVVDSAGRRKVVADGPGVGGTHGRKSRDLPAGDAFRVQGQLTSRTAEANAEGTYKVIIKTEDGIFQEIEARTDFMGLAAERSTTHVPNFVAQEGFA